MSNWNELTSRGRVTGLKACASQGMTLAEVAAFYGVTEAEIRTAGEKGGIVFRSRTVDGRSSAR